MIILGIESSAHTFGVGVVRDEPPHILADVRFVYKPKTGGIHPKEASQYFMSNAPEAVKEALSKAGVKVRDLDGIAVALGPGMGPCLRVGATLARAMASYYGKPLIPVNHALAHVEIGKMLFSFKNPLIVYLSGGNTLIASFSEGRYRIFGETLDISLGNFLDTLARELGIAPPYVVSGLHQIDRCAQNGKNFIELPYVVKGQDVSFSGLLTAALKLYKSSRAELSDICYSAREIAYSAIIEVSERALAHTGNKEVLVVGGVASSPVLRSKFEVMSRLRGVELGIVPPQYAVDNGVMIAWTGLLLLKHGVHVRPEEAYVRQRWKLDQVDVPWLARTNSSGS
ncbi:MAG: N(6)-L-threonylcarbamoyladenine synthase Kae1 [Desulfurococcaceae archaeon]|jgi:N6-L-threonylcarbamoyladenine synthase|nr:N(6)-L-threonylcarbamoyladenine synthase Kae1 [Desulfurococcaceae archaeon]